MGTAGIVFTGHVAYGRKLGEMTVLFPVVLVSCLQQQQRRDNWPGARATYIVLLRSRLALFTVFSAALEPAWPADNQTLFVCRCASQVCNITPAYLL